MSTQSSTQNVIAASVSAPIINASGPNGIVTATTIKANTFLASNFSVAALQTSAISANTVTLGGQLVLSATAQGLVQTATPFAPITRSGIVDIQVQGQCLAFQGNVFSNASGGTSSYSYLLASANLYINVNDPQATQIPDIMLAPRDATGNVYYQTDLTILHPTDPNYYSGFMTIEASNKGVVRMGLLDDATATANVAQTGGINAGSIGNYFSNIYPSHGGAGATTSVEGVGAGNAFRFKQGDMFVSQGWEVIRPQVLSNAVCTQFPASRSISALNPFPGSNIFASLGLSAYAVGLGATFPSCYTDAAFTKPVTGLCVDAGYFPFANVASNAPPTYKNSFIVYYPVMPDAPYELTIGININGEIGTPVVVDPDLYSVNNGYGVIGGYIPATGLEAFTFTGGQSHIATSTVNGVTTANVNPAWCTVDRARLMLDVSGNLMTTARPDLWTKYAAVLQADSSGILRDYGCEYLLTYTGFNTKPAILGRLGLRDMFSYLRYGSAGNSKFLDDTGGFWSSFAGRTSKVLSFSYSQVSGIMRGFMYNGFNIDAAARPVIDGFLLTESSEFYRPSDSQRFCKSNDGSNEHYGPTVGNSSAPTFPFAYQTLYDPVSAKTDGILAKYANYPSCNPKIYQCMGPNAYFGYRASLMFSDPIGQPIAELPNTKFFLLTGVPHFISPNFNSTVTKTDFSAPSPLLEGLSQGNALVPQNQIWRALYVHLKTFVSTGISPVNSYVPTLGSLQMDTSGGYPGAVRYYSTGSTLQFPQATEAKMGFPDLSKIVIPNQAVLNPLTGAFSFITNDYGLDWIGTQYFEAPYSTLPNNINAAYVNYPGRVKYAVLLPKTDSSGIGNDVAGVPLPEMAAPLCTVRGFGTYIQGYNKNDVPFLTTAQIPLSSNAASRFLNDPRPTIQQLYTNVATWSNTWNVAVDNLISSNLMLGPSVFPYDKSVFLARGAYQAGLLNTRRGLPLI